MAASPDFGVDFEPMVFGNAAPPAPEPSEAQGRVIDGVPVRAVPVRTLAYDLKCLPARPPTAADLKRHLRARLAVVKAEIRARKKLEAERDELLRLLAAAGNKTPKPSRADVRPIRTAAG